MLTLRDRLTRLGVEIYDDPPFGGAQGPPPTLDPRPFPLVFRLAAVAFVILALFALIGLALEVW